MSSEARGITTGLSLLVQKSLVSRTKIIDHLGVTMCCQLYLGMWRHEQVLVKLYSSNDHLWKNEITMYQVCSQQNYFAKTELEGSVFLSKSHLYVCLRRGDTD